MGGLTMLKIEAVVMIEDLYQKMCEEMKPLAAAGFDTIFHTFSEVSRLHKLAERLAEDTFLFRLEGEDELVNGFTEQTESIRRGIEGFSDFINRAILFNPEMGEPIDLNLRMNAAVELACIRSEILEKLAKLESAGADLRIFEQDLIKPVFQQLCGLTMGEEYKDFIRQYPIYSQEHFFKNLTNMYNETYPR